MALSPTSRCSVCSTTINKDAKLFRCAGCSVLHYCSRDHQVVHWNEHKRACNAIRKARQSLDKEEQKLRAHPGDFMTPPNLFEECVGHFWGIFETRNYMRSRYALVEALLEIKNYAAVEAAQDHIRDILRLCRSDNMGTRDLLPALCLRLGRDQECYDFCKWYATTGSECKYDWGNMDLGFLDVKDADVFESLPNGFLSRYGNLSLTVAVTLLKIRLLLDLRALQNSMILRRKVAPEILDIVRSQLVTTLILGNSKIMNSADQRPAVRDLEKQVQMLYSRVGAHNKQFWPALLNPRKHLGAQPHAYSAGSLEEMQMVLNHSYDSWKETPGAIEVIRTRSFLKRQE
ncbi:MAG: hypothetical protein Q9186_006908 [Xanthomendoza sp. 1 TL-2023]